MRDKYAVSIIWEDEQENDSSHGAHIIAWFDSLSLALEYARWQCDYYARWTTFVRVDVRKGGRLFKSYQHNN